MTLLRSQVRFQGFTNVPQDLFTNTLYWYSDDTLTPVAAATAAQALLEDFYADAFQGGMMSPVVANTGHFVQWYNMGDPEPRVPILTAPMPVPSRGSANGLPEEVAVVMSFQGAKVSGFDQRNRRGRIYLGPLSVTAITQGGSAAFASSSSTFRANIRTACRTYLLGAFSGVQWSVFSPTNLTSTPVVDGWIDFPLDTQRRRGSRALGRLIIDPL